MAMVYGEFRSIFRDDAEIVGGASDRNTYFGHHDIHTGSFVLATCLGDSEGAEVYRFENLDIDRDRALNKIGKLLVPKNVYVHLLPWFRSEPIPTHMDNGEPGELTIVHLPRIQVDLVRDYY